MENCSENEVQTAQVIPDECYVVETNPDLSKKVTCKKCSKVFKSEKNVKQHISAVYKSLKRMSDVVVNTSQTQNKILKVVETDAAAKLDNTEAFCDDLLNEEEVDDQSFNLDESVDNFVDKCNEKP